MSRAAELPEAFPKHRVSTAEPCCFHRGSCFHSWNRPAVRSTRCRQCPSYVPRAFPAFCPNVVHIVSCVDDLLRSHPGPVLLWNCSARYWEYFPGLVTHSALDILKTLGAFPGYVFCTFLAIEIGHKPRPGNALETQNTETKFNNPFWASPSSTKAHAPAGRWTQCLCAAENAETSAMARIRACISTIRG